MTCLTRVTFPTGYSAAGALLTSLAAGALLTSLAAGALLTSLAAESKVSHPSFGNDIACQSKGVADSYDAAMPA